MATWVNLGHFRAWLTGKPSQEITGSGQLVIYGIWDTAEDFANDFKQLLLELIYAILGTRNSWASLAGYLTTGIAVSGHYVWKPSEDFAKWLPQ